MNEHDHEVDNCYPLTRIVDFPVVLIHAIPDGIVIDADEAELTLAEARSLLEQLQLAINQASHLEYEQTENEWGTVVTRIVEKEEGEK